MKKSNIDIGTRLLVFDSLLFKDDITTPLSVTMKPATVIKRYSYTSKHSGYFYPDLVDVKFDHIRFPHLKGKEKYISRGHFTSMVELLNRGE